ncbi:hypothetical protein Kpol_1025p10 [Vanderwaltozyma polyspora DSM 70294]|uniref:Defect at low temperature protein 1 n=1 Tax=Vanderwaltozyma polyspora (strain ATCC 22028 / DSM 70294 / BCRC 21397 / CBS 2163 / NBRC 10782 / NRRL Y-8283 / UCD 57-17) TaxID=436907 RepID=DLT1_VANPO|nr:uncharacterized protein Kpol_1025p10 [Vanderwaltozyma polyspora DSM 70294]A7TKT6.1 RecName: Full=Defect at low temperature protein 1 [Vanderwaltozyma polyspora DSM 70294]EDO17091.1 hypothetical protein Kpol_1025p10 [Vanderwaltozyma polyspora DSM 70294]
MTGISLLWLWSKRGFIFISYVFLVCFAAVLPIDSIAQASQSSNNALNTFIVVGALVIFAVVCIILIVGRSLYFKSCLQDVPRRYIPSTAIDLPHRGSRELVTQGVEASKQLSTMFIKPKDPVIHPGVEPPERCDDPNIDKVFPEYLNYHSCIKNIADRFKYKGVFMSVDKNKLDIDSTFSDIVREKYIISNENVAVKQNAERLIELYEVLRFSGNPITREQFVYFVELCIYLVEHSLTHHIEEDLTKFPSNTMFSIGEFSTGLQASRIQSRYSAAQSFENDFGENLLNAQLSELLQNKSRIEEERLGRLRRLAGSINESEDEAISSSISRWNTSSGSITNSYSTVVRH